MDRLIHEQMVSDLKFMKSLDSKWGITQDVPTKDTVLDEMIKRYRQYRGIFPGLGNQEYFILQTIGDFNKHLMPLQVSKKKTFTPKVNYGLPVCQINGKMIYAVEHLNTSMDDMFVYKIGEKP